jgi:hypothetical protein
MTEMGHLEVWGKVNGKVIHSIDPMFENYPPAMHEPWHSGMYDFFGKIPQENRYLYNHVDPERGATAVIVASPPPGTPQLPPDWWDYATVYYEDGTIKEPTKPSPNKNSTPY